MQDIHDPAMGRGCLSLFVWAGVARVVFIPVAVLLPDHLSDGQQLFLGFGLSMVLSALLVLLPLRWSFRRVDRRRRLAHAALAYRRRQDDRFP